MDFSSYTNSSKIHYDVLTAGEAGPVVVFVPGWCGGVPHWRHQVAHFSATAQVKVIAPSYRTSQPTHFDIEHIAEGMAEIIASLPTTEKLYLVGHSMGGRVIACLAALLAGRVDGLIGIEAFWDLSVMDDPNTASQTLAKFENDLPTQTKAYLATMFPQLHTATHTEAVYGALEASQSLAISALESVLKTNNRQREWLKKANCKKAVINTTFWRPTAREVAEDYGFRVELIEDVSHYVMLDAPGRTNKMLAAVLEEWENT